MSSCRRPVAHAEKFEETRTPGLDGFEHRLDGRPVGKVVLETAVGLVKHDDGAVEIAPSVDLGIVAASLLRRHVGRRTDEGADPRCVLACTRAVFLRGAMPSPRPGDCAFGHTRRVACVGNGFRGYSWVHEHDLGRGSAPPSRWRV